ncbi:PWI domain-containing protein [Aspergillus campestris IBT 28561]|uniref:PWI domain-containing protein n=1 Tax=Aspergillus campestris (strain IBT 28561) TaxID=1392248 RepID=A0A2I1DDQ4_ASPC2|nr:PWI domain-containing protein [Aspergillus campestris IBT 28561]PKY07986.1 PWI domain-containing protein [Aspergillus campestris IBT 28561]
MATSVDAKLLRRTKFPPEFSRKVDMTKVNIEVMKKWIAGKISEILGNEDDVVIELCFNLLEGTRYPDIKSLQIQLTGFLDKDTANFCKELWSLCLSGQENPQGVPKELLEAKKLELIQEKLEAEKAAEQARRQKEQEQRREREMEDLRRRDRSDRGRGGRRGGRGGGRDFERRPSPPRRRSRERFRDAPPSRRDFDSYVPSRRSRRPSRSRSRSVSSSRSPPPRRQQRYSSRDRDRRRRRRSASGSISPERRRSAPRRRGSPDYGDRTRSQEIAIGVVAQLIPFTAPAFFPGPAPEGLFGLG